MNEKFLKDVEAGLSSEPKFLSSKYFYDATGDDLFIQIMNMPEYYLTNSEFEIFKEKTNELIQSFGIDKKEYFELIELGAGDGTKTIELLKVLEQQEFNYEYIPIDISSSALENLQNKLHRNLPTVRVSPKQGDYFEVLSSFKKSNHKKIVLFLGSNIGNLNDELSAKFIYLLGSNIKQNDILLLGVDLIKQQNIVLPAYNDAFGITAKFNLNLLHRINNELGANFVVEQFEHKPEYTEEEGIAKSFLVSKIDQEVHLSKLDKTYHFSKGEKIRTEISRKYNDEILEKILAKTDFQVTNKILDSKKYFADYILKKTR